MRLGQTKNGQKKETPAKDAKRGLAQVAIQFGRYVSLQTRDFLQEIRDSDHPVEEVAKRSVDEFAEAGMPELTDSYQKKGAGKLSIKNMKDQL